jgi:arylsulfatase
MPGPADTYIAYGRNWANVSNTPFREYKHWVHEGGISTPLIVHWPKGIRSSRNGQLETQPGHIVDLMATCVDVSRAKYPKERAMAKIKRMEGVSLLPAFNGKSVSRPKPIFWEHEGNRAVRDGKWKLVAKENQPWELYDMDKDRSEMHNLAETNPNKVKELASAWDTFAEKSNVLPLGAWRNKRAQALDRKQRYGE